MSKEELKLSVVTKIENLKSINNDYIDAMEKAISLAVNQVLRQRINFLETEIINIYKYLQKQNRGSIFFEIFTSVLLGPLAGFAIKKAVGAFVGPLFGSRNVLVNQQALKTSLKTKTKSKLIINGPSELKFKVEDTNKFKVEITNKTIHEKSSPFAMEAFEEISGELASYTTPKLLESENSPSFNKGLSGHYKLDSIEKMIYDSLEPFKDSNNFFDHIKNYVFLEASYFKDEGYLKILDGVLSLLLDNREQDRNKRLLRNQMELLFEMWLWLKKFGHIREIGTVQKIYSNSFVNQAKDKDSDKKTILNMGFGQGDKDFSDNRGDSGENDYLFPEAGNLRQMVFKFKSPEGIKKYENDPTYQINWKVKNNLLDYWMDRFEVIPSNNSSGLSSKSKPIKNQGLTYKGEYIRQQKQGDLQFGWGKKRERNTKKAIEKERSRNTAEFNRKVRMEMGKKLFIHFIKVEKEFKKF